MKRILFIAGIVLYLLVPLSIRAATKSNYTMADIKAMVRMSSPMIDYNRFPDTILSEKINLQCLEMATLGNLIEKNFFYVYSGAATYSIDKRLLFTGSTTNYLFYVVKMIAIKHTTASGGDTTTLKYVPIDQLYKEPTYSSKSGVADQYCPYSSYVFFNGKVQDGDTLFGAAYYYPTWMNDDLCVISIPPMYVSELVDGVTESCMKSLLPVGQPGDLQSNKIPVDQVQGKNMTVEEYLEQNMKGRAIDDK